MGWFRKTAVEKVYQKRYNKFGVGVGKMSTHSPEFLDAYKRFVRGLGPEPEHVEIEVVIINTISGPRRVWVDRVDEYKEVLK